MSETPEMSPTLTIETEAFLPPAPTITNPEPPETPITNKEQLQTAIKQAVKHPELTILTPETKQPGIQAAISGEPANLDAAIAADYENNALIQLPLRTSWETLTKFAELTGQESPGSHLFSSVDYVVRNMDFNMYWQLRNFQYNNMAEELQNLLNLTVNEQGELKEQQGLAKIIDKVDQFLRAPFNERLSEQEKIEYLNKMLELVKGVSIEVEQDEETDPKKKKKIAHMKKSYPGEESPTEMCTITEDSQKNIMEFRINPKLFEDTSEQGKKKLEDAMALTLDQATRLLERNQDKQYKLKIKGYTKSPELVLRMFYNAKLHGHNPTIDPATLKAWEQLDPNRYKDAMELYNKLNQDIPLDKLRQLEDNKILKKSDAQKSPAPQKPTDHTEDHKDTPHIKLK